MKCSFTKEYIERKRREGIKEAKKDTARGMLDLGFSVEEVSAVTLLSVDKIRRL